MPAPKGNKYAIGNNGGRPPKYKSAKELEAQINAYFDHIQGEKRGRKWIRPAEAPTVTGLALFLGFASRQSLLDYKEKQEFTDIIKRAVTVIEHGYELKLSGTTATGAIFALKNMGWQDKYYGELTGKDGKDLYSTKTDDELKDLLKSTLSKLE
jgi:hypothetical protein